MSEGADPTELLKLWRSNFNPALFLNRAETHLDMALQPIVDIRSGRVHGYEALVRNVEHLGLTSIAALFDLAHANQSLPALDLMLRRKAAAKFAKVERSHVQTLFYNIDGRIFESERDNLDETESLLEALGLSMSDLCLELSESYRNTASPQFFQIMARSRERGVRFALDDFGQGYSGLRVLYDCNVDFLKIDRFFVSAIQRDSKKRLFVTSVVDLAHVLGVKVIAEGVETAEELHTCREIGCDLLQGYFVSPPLLEPDKLVRSYVQLSHAPDRHKEPRTTGAETILAEIASLPTILEGSCMEVVLQALEAHPDQYYFPIVDKHDIPKGIVSERDIKPYVYRPFGRDLLKNKSSPVTLSSVSRPCPIADINSDLERLIDLVTDDVDEGVIITSEMKYRGFISSKSLLKISNMIRLHQAREENPLTRLPANARINEFISEALEKTDADRIFCFLDFDHFKPFNDTYGFRTGDRAIVLFADLMRKILNEKDWFLGHVGGDDFFAGVVSGANSEYEIALTRLRENFASDAESFYDAEHRAQGYIVAEQRNGAIAKFPLLSCSIAALKVSANSEVRDPELVIREIATLKKEAKLAPDGIACRECCLLPAAKAGAQRAA